MNRRTAGGVLDSASQFYRKDIAASCLPGQFPFVESCDGLLLTTAPTPMDTTPSSAPSAFMLLFRNSGPETHQHLSPAQRQQLMTRWNAWYDDLAAQSKAVEGQPLELETRVVSGAGGSRVIDGPFPETKEAIGGYVKLLVRDLDEATEIARQHPGLVYGLAIEVRQMLVTCHLGVTASSQRDMSPAAGAV